MRVNSGSGLASRVSWWRNAVIYEIYLRSFADGDGDGIGTFPDCGPACRICGISA